MDCLLRRQQDVPSAKYVGEEEGRDDEKDSFLLSWWVKKWKLWWAHKWRSKDLGEWSKGSSPSLLTCFLLARMAFILISSTAHLFASKSWVIACKYFFLLKINVDVPRFALVWVQTYISHTSVHACANIQTHIDSMRAPSYANRKKR